MKTPTDSLKGAPHFLLVASLMLSPPAAHGQDKPRSDVPMTRPEAAVAVLEGLHPLLARGATARSASFSAGARMVGTPGRSPCV